MIRPSQAWCLEIDITNACMHHCSNCTRVLDHARLRFFMTPEQFEAALLAVKDFVTDGERDPKGRGKVIGLIGGEPLLHPQFPDLVDLMQVHVPRRANRAIFTAKDWKREHHPKWGSMKVQIDRLLGPHEGQGRGKDPITGEVGGYLNWNMHLPEMQVSHQPVLAASRELVTDEKERWDLIENCWLQDRWSPAATVDGFYFCEVAGAIDRVLYEGAHALPLEPGCWKGNLDYITREDGVRQPTGRFAEQIKFFCQQCGVCVPMEGRPDSDEVDDVTPGHIAQLEKVRSPRLVRGRVNIMDVDGKLPTIRNWKPAKYIRGKAPKDQGLADRRRKK